MTTEDTCCTVVPYFDVPDDYMATFKAKCPEFVASTMNEPGCLYYGFTFNGNIAHCREGYANAEAVLAHLANVSEALGEILKHTKLARFEIHGPESELAKLREPLASLSPQFFVLEMGFRR